MSKEPVILINLLKVKPGKQDALIALLEQNTAPSTLVRHVACHAPTSISSTAADGPNTPALLNSTSTRPNADTDSANKACTDTASVTSVGTMRAAGCPAADSTSK